MRKGPTEQVKRAKRQLKKAGFGRSDAGVRVERRHYRDPAAPRGYFTEYGDAKIVLWDAHEPDVIAKVPRLLECGFDVTLWARDASRPHANHISVDEAPTWRRAPRFEAVQMQDGRLVTLSRDPQFALDFAEELRRHNTARAAH